MARIETYTSDSVINGGDKIIGTDGAEGANNATKNYTVSDLTTYIIDQAFNGTDTYIPVFDGTSSIINSALKQNAASSPATLTVGTGVTFAVTTNATVGGTLGVTGATTVGSTLGVTGASTFTGATTHNGGLSSTTGDFSGAVGVDGNFDVNTNKFTVNATTGNTAAAGTLYGAGNVGSTNGSIVSGDSITTGTASYYAAGGQILQATASGGVLTQLEFGDLGAVDMPIYFRQNDNPVITLDTAGNAAVGATSASGYKLYVSGTFSTTGLASLDGGIDVDGAFTVANATGAIATSAAAALTATANAAEIKLGNDTATSAQTIRFQGTAGDVVFTGGYNESDDREHERFSIGWAEDAGTAIDGTWISGEREETYDQDILNIGSTALDFLYLTVQPGGTIQANEEIKLSGNGDGIIMKSPDGTAYRVTVANGGTLTVSAV